MRLQRMKRIMLMRLKVPPAINQFNSTINVFSAKKDESLPRQGYGLSQRLGVSRVAETWTFGKQPRSSRIPNFTIMVKGHELLCILRMRRFVSQEICLAFNFRKAHNVLMQVPVVIHGTEQCPFSFDESF